jgi:hypothetical protein
MGQPDGRLARAGKRVSMRYVGRLKKGGKVFDSNTKGKPFSFRLGERVASVRVHVYGCVCQSYFTCSAVLGRGAYFHVKQVRVPGSQVGSSSPACGQVLVSVAGSHADPQLCLKQPCQKASKPTKLVSIGYATVTTLLIRTIGPRSTRLLPTGVGEVIKGWDRCV